MCACSPKGVRTILTSAPTEGRTSQPVDAIATSVWERVWRSEPSVERDEYLLARERSGPRWAEIVSRLTSAFGRIDGLRTIELGSGRGDLSVLLAERGAHVKLLDMSASALEQAQRRFERRGLSAAFQQADMFDPPAACLGQYDVALSSGVIEHFVGSHRTQAIAAHGNVVRPGGMIAISVPHASCPPYRLWKWYLEVRRRWPYGFERPYSKREISRRAIDAGLDSVESRAMALWHSISAHWLRDLMQMDVDWANRRSRMDKHWGLILLLFGRKPGNWNDHR